MKVNGTRSIILLCLILFSVTLSVYWQTGNHEFLNFDDNEYVCDNLHVAKGVTGANIIWAFTSVEASNWHPVTWLSHMLDVQLYGMNPRGHHLTSVFIHAVSALLLFLLLFRLTGSPWQSSFVAALFALHPLHVESVAWVAERKDVLSAFFCFLTLLLYSEYVAKRKSPLYILSLSSFVLGLMAKPMLVTLPVIMLLMDFWPLNRYCLKEREPGQDNLLDRLSPFTTLLKEKIPFFVCSLFSATITIYAQHKGGAIRNFVEMPFWLRTENAVVAYVKYLAKTLWPLDLAVLYPFPSSIPLWQVFCSLLILLLVSVATVRAGRRHPYLVVGWAWFLVTLLPVIGLFQVGNQSMADRYSYIPIIGLFIMAAWGVPVLTKELKYSRSILALLACAVMIASAALTWQQLRFWQDHVSLFRHTLQVTSGNFMAHDSLGVVLAKKGDQDAAIREYRDALAINPNYALAHFNLGIALAKVGNLDEAIREYREAIRINPNFTTAFFNLGIALAQKGDQDAAIKEFRAALKISPNYFEAQNSLGVALAKKGNLDAAIKEFREVLTINPSYYQAHFNMGNALGSKGDLDGAISEFRQALAINPNYEIARKNLKIVLDLKRSPLRAGNL